MRTYELTTETNTIQDTELVDIHAQLEAVTEEHDLYFLWMDAKSTIENYSEFWTAWEVEELFEKFLTNEFANDAVRVGVYELMLSGKFLAANVAGALLFGNDTQFAASLIRAISSYTATVDSQVIYDALGLSGSPLADALEASKNWGLGVRVGAAFVKQVLIYGLEAPEALRVARWADAV